MIEAAEQPLLAKRVLRTLRQHHGGDECLQAEGGDARLKTFNK